MLSETLSALATAAGTGLVTAMVTDGWLQTSSRVARLLGRGDAQEESRQQDRLDRAHRELTEASGEDVPQARERQAAAWRTRFEDLLEDQPHREAEVRALVDFLTQHAPAAAAGAVQVNAHASDQAQQAVQGQGVQHNTFTPPR